MNVYEDWQRLDWLEMVQVELPVTVEKNVAGAWVVSLGRRVSIQGPTLRAAIDAAMETTGEISKF